MHEEILKANNVKISDGKVAETTLISRVFGGSLRNELKCLSCRFSSKTYNHFQDLSLEISGGISSGDFIHVKFIKRYSQLIIGSHSIEAAPPNRNE
jgi:ubiquitin C-terminal hydrolase